MAVGVVAPELGDPTAASLVGGDGAGGEAPLVAAGKEDPPPAAGVPAVEVEGKGAAVAPSEGAPAAIAVEGEEENEAHKPEDKSEADAADGVPAVEEVEEKGAAAPLEGSPAVITVEGEEEIHKAENKSDAAAEEEEAESEAEEKWLGHYSSGQSILIVGDGDFSFSLALATAFGSGANLVTTSLDTYGLSFGRFASASSWPGKVNAPLLFVAYSEL